MTNVAPFNNIKKQLGKYVNIRLFRGGSVRIVINSLELHVLATCYLLVVKYREQYVDTTHCLHEIDNIFMYGVPFFIKYSVYLIVGPGMSFGSGIVCPQASQTRCDRYQSSFFSIGRSAQDEELVWVVLWMLYTFNWIQERFWTFKNSSSNKENFNSFHKKQYFWEGNPQ